MEERGVRAFAGVVEEGASADYDTDGALVMTLRKQATAQDAGPSSDPEAADGVCRIESSIDGPRRV
ncbi:MAG: hypothetical protein E6J79_19935 [Deltaproteobacteria bacterium]|nr:MAG: hypothetical protein E6J79_19935 [Deltaproteobacteria bacterium]